MRQKNKIEKEIKQKKAAAYKNTGVYFEMTLAIIIIPFFSFLALSILGKNNPNLVNNILPIKSDINVFTEKAYYSTGENIELFVKNNSEEPIYFEPCQYLNRFEKMINGKWTEFSNYEGAKIYDESEFNREKNFVNCKIQLPESGAGTYRAVVQIYYECEKPGGSTCKNSNVFYSNEFEVKS